MGNEGKPYAATPPDGSVRPEFKVSIRIFYSEAEKGYIAEPDWLPHTLRAFGDTPEEALKEICAVLQLVIREGARLGKGLGR